MTSSSRSTSSPPTASATAAAAGSLSTWQEPDALVCEVRDAGTISWPLVGRERPLPERIGGRGVWIVNQLCDLVQIRGLAEENVVRVRMGFKSRG